MYYYFLFGINLEVFRLEGEFNMVEMGEVVW